MMMNDEWCFSSFQEYYYINFVNSNFFKIIFIRDKYEIVKCFDAIQTR